MTCLRATPRSSATCISRAVCLPCPRSLSQGTIQAHLALEGRHKAHCLHQHLRRCPSCGCHRVLFLFCPCPAQPPQRRQHCHQILYVLHKYLLSNLTPFPHQQDTVVNTLNICPRVRGIFAAGATYPITPSSSSSPRCPRHLHHSCEICIASNCGTYRSTFPQGESHSNSVAQGGGITGFAEGVGIGSGLVRSGLGGGTLLRREIISPPPPPPLGDDETNITDHLWIHTQGARDTILTGLIPRFVRLSALVVLELGRESGAEATGPGSGNSPTNNNDAQKALPGPAVVPTVQWYLLLAGLLTRAVFEGYLTAEWKGLEPVQVLMGFGLGGVAISRDADDDDDGAPRRSRPVATDEKYVEFEPDGMPNLSDAVDVLFPSRRANAGTGGGIGDGGCNGHGGEEGRRGNGDGDRAGSDRNGDAAMLTGGEAEYAREMGQRLARVCKIDFPSVPFPPLFFYYLTYAYGFSLIADWIVSW